MPLHGMVGTIMKVKPFRLMAELHTGAVKYAPGSNVSVMGLLLVPLPRAVMEEVNAPHK